MKKILISLVAILFSQFACKSEMDQKTQSQNDIAKVQALAKKYGLDINVTEIPITGRKLPIGTLDGIESQFKMMAEAQESEKENNLQVAQMTEETKNRKELLPSDYLKILDKYPLVKQATIQQQGGEAGFKIYRSKLLAKQDSVQKIQRLMLKK
jgi:hypothetical protein